MRPLVRASAFVSKEVAETVRQPGLLVLLVLAPFAILLLFGVALEDDDPPLRAVFVAPDDPELAEEVERFADEQGDRLVLEEITEDRQEALRHLRQGEVELVVVFPDDAEEQVLAGEQAVVEMHHDQIDPVEIRAVELYTRLAVDELNRQLLVSAIEEGEEQRELLALAAAEGALGDVDPDELEPEVLVAPFAGRSEPVQGAAIDMPDFYAPAVIVVLLQHLMVTFLGLSLVRERQLGVNDLYQLAPLQPGEVVAGKYLGQGLIGAVITAALTAALVIGLGVPMLGSLWALAGVLGLTLLACLGLGLCIALFARSDGQAVQYAMMLLLATVFLGGFLVSIERFVPGLRWLAWLLPATHGITSTRDVMLRGRIDEPRHLVALAMMAVITTLVAWWFMRRRFHRHHPREQAPEPAMASQVEDDKAGPAPELTRT